MERAKEAAAAAVQIPEGYDYDRGSGMYRSKATGLGFDPRSRGFVDGNGKWWYYDTASGGFKPWG